MASSLGTAKSGWCLMPINAVEQHARCKRVYEAKGYDTWVCPCECGHVGEAEASKGKVTVVAPKAAWELPRDDKPAAVRIPRKDFVKPAAKPKDNLTRAERTKGL